MMGPVRLPSSAVPPAPASFRPRKVPHKSFVKKNLPVSPTRSRFYRNSTAQVLKNEDFAKYRGEGVPLGVAQTGISPVTETMLCASPPYCTGGGVMPKKDVPEEFAGGRRSSS